jgi:SnoaL-like domain
MPFRPVGMPSVVPRSPVMTKEDFYRYIDHFNHQRYEEMVPYYADDVEVDLAGIALRGPRAIVYFYTDFHQYVREFLEVKYVVVDEDGVAVELYSEFDCFRDYPDPRLSFKKGDLRRLLNFVHYDLQNGQFKRIRVARYKQVP